jgi:hypothetical protein
MLDKLDQVGEKLDKIKNKCTMLKNNSNSNVYALPRDFQPHLLKAILPKPWKITKRLAVCTLLSTTGLVLLSGCAQHDRFVPFDKEANDPMPTKYETPYTQKREPYRNNPSQTMTIPKDLTADPKVIEPDPYIPGMITTMEGIPVKGKPGFVLSPYAPDKGFVDVRGFPVGTDVRDPYTGKVMKVPVPAEEVRTNFDGGGFGDTLSTPSLQTPELNTDLPPSPPVLEP